MKQANNNEVDLLLRSLARRADESRSQGGAASADGGGALSDHLDADELNSYAEGVVPAPARARYTEHLAECGACRRIVIGLTQASGAAGRHEVSQQPVGSSFWQQLAALFSPAVLRYAVPALVLTAVIGISLLALQQRRPEFIAQNPTADSERSITQLKKTDEALSPAARATPSSLPSGMGAGTSNELQTEKGELEDRKTQADPPPIASVESTLAKPPAAKDSAQPGEDADVARLRPYASEPKAAAPPPAPVTTGEADKSAELAKERPAKREEQDRRDGFKVQTDDEHGPNRSRSNTTAPATGRAGGLMSERGPSADKNKKAGEVETRVVSGRRFTREGNGWVDTDYEPPQATTRVTRGSDQFRALVADEPGIRAIADQLNGVVIVVWKGRAYRIQ